VVALDQAAPEGRQRRAATGRAALAGQHHRLAKALVEAVDQLPGAPVRHAHGATRRRDRAGRVDPFEQRDLAGAQTALGFEIDAQAQLRHGQTLA
jgi:hypothetical protein